MRRVDSRAAAFREGSTFSVVAQRNRDNRLNADCHALNAPTKYTDPDGHIPIIPLLIVGGIVALKVIDYGWTAYDAYQATTTLADPNASEEDKAFAAADLPMMAAFEAAEPDRRKRCLRFVICSLKNLVYPIILAARHE
jgi:hypothetical protein